MDKAQEMMLASLRARHTARVRQDVRGITEETGWLLRDLDAGHLPGHHARNVLTYAQEVVSRLAALEAIRETAEIYDAVPALPPEVDWAGVLRYVEDWDHGMDPAADNLHRAVLARLTDWLTANGHVP